MFLHQPCSLLCPFFLSESELLANVLQKERFNDYSLFIWQGLLTTSRAFIHLPIEKNESKFSRIFLRSAWPMHFKSSNILVMVGSIVVVGALTRCALLHCVCDLKAAQINVGYSLIRELILYEIELSNKVAEATKKICWAKGERTVNRSTTEEISLWSQDTRWSGKVILV